MHLRLVDPGDLDALYDICLRTGDLGGDASHLHGDPRVLGEVFVAPYATFEPQHCFVVADDHDRPVGYCVSTLDSRVFDDTLDREWLPALRERYPMDGDGFTDKDLDTVRLIHQPFSHFPDQYDTHPSHLHIDLLPTAQGQGWGRTLIEAVETSLADAGSTGVQLTVATGNERAVAFYRALDFVELVDVAGAFIVFGHRLPRTR